MNTEKNLGGRPIEHNKEEIAEKLLTWAELDTSINLCAFCSENKILPVQLTRWAADNERFSLSLDLTRAFLGARREVKLSEGKLHTKAYDLNAATYDYFLKYDRRDEKLFDHDLQKKMVEFMHALKKETMETVSDEVKQQFNSLMDQITRLQQKKK